MVLIHNYQNILNVYYHQYKEQPNDFLYSYLLLHHNFNLNWVQYLLKYLYKDWVMNEMNTSPHGPFNCLDF